MSMNNKIDSVIALVAMCLLVANSPAQDTREVKKAVPLKSDGEVSIDTYKGTISVTAWDKPEVSISATIEADGGFDSGDDAQDVKDTEIRIDVSDNRVTIKSDYGNFKHHHRGFWSLFGENSGSMPLVHYTIMMPRTAHLRIKDYKSRTTVRELKSSVELETYKGEVDVTKLSGSIRIDTYKGNVRVGFASMADKSRFETYKGTVTVALPKSSGFELDADLGSRADFNSDFEVELRTKGKRHRDSEFRGPINGGGPSLMIKSEKGSIRLRQL
jgi:hypothetical protein